MKGEAALRKIKEEHNPDHDLPGPGAPRVTFAEFALLQAVHELEKRILMLEKDLVTANMRIDDLNGRSAFGII